MNIIREILHSVKDLKADMSTCNSRIDALEIRTSETTSQGSHAPHG